MKKFSQYLSEDLTLALSEPSTNAAKEAKRLGLKYVGFGRYENPITNQVTHIVQDDKLIPFSVATKSNTSKQQKKSNQFEQFVSELQPMIEASHNVLINHYGKIVYNNDELDSIESYTQNNYEINGRLWNLTPGIKANEIEPMFPNDPTAKTVAGLDSAVSKSSTPIELMVYTSLSENFDMLKLAPNSVLNFNGFRSCSLDPLQALDLNSERSSYKAGMFDTRRKLSILQIRVEKDSKGLYADDYSSSPGEREFILPRGSRVRVLDSPSKIVASNSNYSRNDEIMFYNCELLKDK